MHTKLYNKSSKLSFKSIKEVNNPPNLKKLKPRQPLARTLRQIKLRMISKYTIEENLYYKKVICDIINKVNNRLTRNYYELQMEIDDTEYIKEYYVLSKIFSIIAYILYYYENNMKFYPSYFGLDIIKNFMYTNINSKQMILIYQSCILADNQINKRVTNKFLTSKTLFVKDSYTILLKSLINEESDKENEEVKSVSKQSEDENVNINNIRNKREISKNQVKSVNMNNMNEDIIRLIEYIKKCVSNKYFKEKYENHIIREGKENETEEKIRNIDKDLLSNNEYLMTIDNNNLTLNTLNNTINTKNKKTIYRNSVKEKEQEKEKNENVDVNLNLKKKSRTIIFSNSNTNNKDNKVLMTYKVNNNIGNIDKLYSSSTPKNSKSTKLNIFKNRTYSKNEVHEKNLFILRNSLFNRKTSHLHLFDKDNNQSEFNNTINNTSINNISISKTYVNNDVNQTYHLLSNKIIKKRSNFEMEIKAKSNKSEINNKENEKLNLNFNVIKQLEKYFLDMKREKLMSNNSNNHFSVYKKSIDHDSVRNMATTLYIHKVNSEVIDSKEVFEKTKNLNFNTTNFKKISFLKNGHERKFEIEENNDNESCISNLSQKFMSPILTSVSPVNILMNHSVNHNKDKDISNFIINSTSTDNDNNEKYENNFKYSFVNNFTKDYILNTNSNNNNTTTYNDYLNSNKNISYKPIETIDFLQKMKKQMSNSNLKIFRNMVLNVNYNEKVKEEKNVKDYNMEIYDKRRHTLIDEINFKNGMMKYLLNEKKIKSEYSKINTLNPISDLNKKSGLNCKLNSSSSVGVIKRERIMNNHLQSNANMNFQFNSNDLNITTIKQTKLEFSNKIEKNSNVNQNNNNNKGNIKKTNKKHIFNMIIRNNKEKKIDFNNSKLNKIDSKKIITKNSTCTNIYYS